MSESFGLPEMRQLEAVGFRSWPAETSRFDGTWVVRLTDGHDAKRLNSVNPMDRGDQKDIKGRVLRLAQRFDRINRPLTFRLTPLAPQHLAPQFSEWNWQHMDESRVMVLNLEAARLEDSVAQLPLKDRQRWTDQCVVMGGFPASVKPGLVDLINRVEGEVGLFLSEERDGKPLAAAMAVRFGALVGLFEVVSNPHMRGQGLGRRIVRTALDWGRSRGAKKAWLQVVADNGPANRLYESEGFCEAYRYSYWRAPDNFTDSL